MTIKENIAYSKEFGFNILYWKLLDSITKSISKSDFALKIHEKNYKIIENYIYKQCTTIIKNAKSNNYKNDKHYIENKINKNVKINKTIWIMWWQGEKEAPPIVKACIESARKNSNGHPVIVIDENNYKEYIKIPDFIIEKYQKGQKDKSPLKGTVLSRTHFSDIIRILLLYQYGGIWADSTVFFTKPIPEAYFESEFTTIGEDDDWYVRKGIWSIWFIGCHANSPLTKFLYQMLCEYWKNNDYWISYLMIYNMMNIAYENVPEIKEILDIFTPTNRQALTINRNYNKEVDIEKIESFLKVQTIHKLSWRWWGNQSDSNMNIYTSEGKLTYFGYLYENYILKIK